MSSSSSVGHLPQAGRGITMMILSCLFLTISDSVAKYLLPVMPAGEIIGFRAIFALMIFAAYLAARRQSWPRVNQRRGGQVLNALLLAITLYCFTLSLAYLDLAEAVLIIYLSPLFVTLLAPLVLKEVVGWRRRLATLVGFVGAALVLSPSGDGFHWMTLLPVVSAIAMSWRDLLLRSLMATEDPLSVLVTSCLALLALGLFTMPFDFAPPSPSSLGILFAAGFLFLFGHLAMIQGFRMADAALVSPFKYSAVLFAVVLGALIWDELPDIWDTLGGVLIIGSGIYVFRREVLRRKESEPL